MGRLKRSSFSDFSPCGRALRIQIRISGSFLGAWLSLVERYVRDVEVAGSNPVAPKGNLHTHQQAFRL
jgi:hypothetical protein